MPGKNSNFDVSKVSLVDRFIFAKAYLWVMLVIVGIELFGMIRFYYCFPNRRHSTASYLITLFWVVCDI